MKIIWEKWEDPFNSEEDLESDVPSKSHKALYHPNFGVFPKSNLQSPGRTFNLWVLHLDIIIDYYTGKTIEDVAGVETFDALTPYRCRIGIGKAFNETEVKLKIQEKLIDAENWIYGNRNEQS